MSNIAELVTLLGEQSKLSREAYKQYQQLKQQEDQLRAGLVEELATSGLKSAKTAKFTASIAQRKGIVINHEQSVIEWLKTTPDIETDQYIGLKRTEFKTLAMALLKDTGEIIPGTDLEVTESLTIRSNK